MPSYALEPLTERTCFSQVPMFNGMQEEAVVRICYALRPLACMEGDHIFKEGELGQEISPPGRVCHSATILI